MRRLGCAGRWRARAHLDGSVQCAACTLGQTTTRKHNAYPPRIRPLFKILSRMRVRSLPSYADGCPSTGQAVHHTKGLRSRVLKKRKQEITRQRCAPCTCAACTRRTAQHANATLVLRKCVFVLRVYTCFLLRTHPSC